MSDSHSKAIVMHIEFGFDLRGGGRQRFAECPASQGCAAIERVSTCPQEKFRSPCCHLGHMT
eukprot:5418341-Amphidinium_carterae.1